ncbi:MAG: hypothetical protein JXX28_03025 [Deltaproteobacteria bacterium]|nr:hypothetical protein [Deltaproteobacteria bacterium]
MRKGLLLPVLGLALSGCWMAAPEGAHILVPDRLAVTWHASFNAEDDGVGAVIPVDILVYEAGTGEPLAGVALEISAESEGVEVLAEATRLQLELGEEPLDGDVWDVWQDGYYQLDEPAAEGTLDLMTDEDGLARIYLYVDSFPEWEGDAWLPVGVLVSSRLEDVVFELVPR